MYTVHNQTQVKPLGGRSPKESSVYWGNKREKKLLFYPKTKGKDESKGNKRKTYTVARSGELINVDGHSAILGLVILLGGHFGGLFNEKVAKWKREEKKREKKFSGLIRLLGGGR